MLHRLHFGRGQAAIVAHIEPAFTGLDQIVIAQDEKVVTVIHVPRDRGLGWRITVTPQGVGMGVPTKPTTLVVIVCGLLEQRTRGDDSGEDDGDGDHGMSRKVGRSGGNDH